jgi:HAD superfamily hydrolase (TIGR01509 family)
MKALIFDCDGVLADTERDGHRVAFNRTFTKMGYPVEWSVDLYGELLKIAGGKERMKHYFDRNDWPEDNGDREKAIKELHRLKTDAFLEIIETGQLSIRSGITRLVDEAIENGTLLGVCSTSNKRSVALIVERLLGPERKAAFQTILAGDVVSRKKPDPEIYNLAKKELGVKGRDCVVVEDSRNGLLAAKSAGMYCIITKSSYTQEEDFREADLVVPDLGDPSNVNVTLEMLTGLAKE